MRRQPIMALGAVLLTVAALAVAGCGTSIGTTTAQNAYTITEPVTSLTIDNPVGDTRIEGTDAMTVSVTEQLHYSDNPPQTSHTVTGSQLALSYTCPSSVINADVCSVTYVVKVPRRIEVKVEGKVGTTTLAGLAGQLTLSSSTGSIDATGLASGSVTARTGAGSITLEFITPPTLVDAQAQVGSVTVRLPAGTTYVVDAGSQVGNVDVTVQQEPASGHRVTAHSQVGSVTVSNS